MSLIWDYVKRKLKFLRDLPPELARQFEEFKDIKSIDRINTSAWIGIFLTFCLFGLDYFRWVNNRFPDHRDYQILIFIHAIGFLFVPLIIYLHQHKDFIVKSRLRRGIVIWSMVVIAFAFLLGQATVVYYFRGTTTIYLGFVFIGSWMFSMSHKERALFFTVCLTAISWCILHRPDDWILTASGIGPAELQLKTGEQLDKIVMDSRVVSFIEVFFLSLVAFVFDAYDYNQKLENFLSLLQIEKEQKRIMQLEAFKSRFFTNLTHEFRTPLTTIMGMSNEIAKDPKKWTSEGTNMIRKNAQSLLDLVNQVLSISKIESGALPTHMIQGNIVSFTGYIIDSLKGQALVRQINLHFLPDQDDIVMDYDPEKYTIILSNLVSNAVKFSPDKSNVYISLAIHEDDGKQILELSIRDQGMGIPKNELDRIFERFYQVDTPLSASGIGTGIGLSLVKELVEMLKGDIRVSSQAGKGSQFVVELPIHHDSPLITEHDHGFETMSSAASFDNNEQKTFAVPIQNDHRPYLLVIEDNDDVRKYLEICLSDHYQLSFAQDGEAGIQQAIAEVPDLILSDVLMPVKDGLVVCSEVRMNPATSHVPIILLSAKADTESRIQGLQSGADAYLAKPFEKEELLALIHTLMARFKDYQVRYSNPESIQSTVEIANQDVEDEFITRFRKLVYDHLDDAEFAVHDLERGLFLSRSQLHKKLKALTGLSAMQFVNRIRLSIAREKLRADHESVSDIAYQVGYSDPNYFTRAYSAEFGETPSETRKHFNKN